MFGTNSVAWAAAALGVQAAGATMVPIYPASTGEAARYVLEHAEVTTAFVSTAQRPALAAAGQVDGDVLADAEGERLIEHDRQLGGGERAVEIGHARRRERRGRLADRGGVLAAGGEREQGAGEGAHQ